MPDRTDADVDEEDAAPPERLGQNAADDGPSAKPMEAMAVHRPIAFAFAFGSGNAALTRASEATLTMAGADALQTAPDVQHGQAGASPHSADATAKRARPPR